MLQACVLEFLLVHAAECNTTAISFENEVAMRITNQNNPRLQQLLIEIFQLLVEGRSLFD